MNIHQVAIAATYEDVAGLCVAAAVRFYRTYGGELDDLIGIANLVFTETYTLHKPTDPPFTPWVQKKIHYRLLDELRKSCGRNRDLTYYRNETEAAPDTFWVEIKADLAEDDLAILVLDTINNAPSEFMELLKDTAGDCRKAKHALMSFLRGKGHKKKDVEASFKTIQHYLVKDVNDE